VVAEEDLPEVRHAPHCDSMDGPVVRAARHALDTEDVEIILPYVHTAGEEELRRAFEFDGEGPVAGH